MWPLSSLQNTVEIQSRNQKAYTYSFEGEKRQKSFYNCMNGGGDSKMFSLAYWGCELF